MGHDDDPSERGVAHKRGSEINVTGSNGEQEVRHAPLELLILFGNATLAQLLQQSGTSYHGLACRLQP
jgi:hypothetical protein